MNLQAKTEVKQKPWAGSSPMPSHATTQQTEVITKVFPTIKPPQTDRQPARQAGRQTDRQTVTGRNGKIETWINRELERQFATELERLRVREIERQRATKTDRKRHSENRLHKTRCKVHACLLPYSIQGQFPFPGRAGASDTTKGAGWSWKHMAMLHVFRL